MGIQRNTDSVMSRIDWLSTKPRDDVMSLYSWNPDGWISGYVSIHAWEPKIMDGGGAGPSVFRIDPGLFLGKSHPRSEFLRGGLGGWGWGGERVSILYLYLYSIDTNRH